MRKKSFFLLRMSPQIWLFILPLIAALFIAGYTAQSRELSDASAQVAQLTAERDLLEEEVLRLHRKVEFSQTDEFIEREARSKLNLIKPGEILFLPAD
jgi:cell division protein FtsB